LFFFRLPLCFIGIVKNQTNTKETTMKTTTALLTILLLIMMTPFAQAMPGPSHDALARRLLGTPASRGGSQGLSEEMVRTISGWMDNPTSKTGEFRLSGLEGNPKVTPNNHQHIRHNPVSVAKALSGNGTVDPRILNQARLHKIGDVAVNRASGVDGWTITPKMRKQAKKMVSYVEKHNRLPKKLPPWVDESGDLIKVAAKTRSVSSAAQSKLRASGQADDAARAVKETSKQGGKATAKALSSSDDTARAAGQTAKQSGKAVGKEAGKEAGKAAGKAAKIGRGLSKAVGPIALLIEGGIRGKQAHETEQAFKNGEIDKKKRVKKHARSGGQMAGGTGGAVLGAKIGAGVGLLTGPGAPVCVPLFTVIGAIGGGLGGDAAGGYVAGKTAENILEKQGH
jgi:hypothetical protein